MYKAIFVLILKVVFLLLIVPIIGLAFIDYVAFEIQVFYELHWSVFLKYNYLYQGVFLGVYFQKLKLKTFFPKSMFNSQ